MRLTCAHCCPHLRCNLNKYCSSLLRNLCNESTANRLIGFQASICNERPRSPQGCEVPNEVQERNHLVGRDPKTLPYEVSRREAPRMGLETSRALVNKDCCFQWAAVQ